MLLVAPAMGALIVWAVWQASKVLVPNTTTVIVEAPHPTEISLPAAVLPPFLTLPTATLAVVPVPAPAVVATGPTPAAVLTGPSPAAAPTSIANPVAVAPAVGVTLAAVGPTVGVNPAAPVNASPAANAGSGVPQMVYVVEAGDTVARIATRYGVQPEAIFQANGFTDRARQLRIGERLIVPGATGTPVATVAVARAAPATRTSTPVSSSSGQRVHVVEDGDSLGGIAEKYDVTLDALLAANGLDDRDGVLRVGQRLVIPDADAP